MEEFYTTTKEIYERCGCSLDAAVVAAALLSKQLVAQAKSQEPKIKIKRRGERHHAARVPVA